MNKVYFQNFGAIVTNKCNLDCGHCLRGCKNDKEMSKEVIEKTFEQIYAVSALSICGGEPTLALEPIENIINAIIEKNICIVDFALVINGTNYSEELLRLLTYINDYLKSYSKKSNVILTISYDQYHIQELIRHGLLNLYKENILRYKESKFYYGLNQLDPKLKLYKEGNAAKLDDKLTVEYRPIDLRVTYAGKDEKKLCCIGPILAVNTDGIITECDVSIENQERKFNYGNVFDNTFEEIALERGKLVTPRQFNRQTKKIIKKQVR